MFHKNILKIGKDTKNKLKISLNKVKKIIAKIRIIGQFILVLQLLWKSKLDIPIDDRPSLW